MLIYHWFAKTYRWTPRQVDELYLEETEWLPMIGQASSLAEEVLQSEERAQSNSRYR